MLVGKWIKCDSCNEILYKEDVKRNFSVCPNCGKHFRISARRRIKQIIDEGTFEELDEEPEVVDWWYRKDKETGSELTETKNTFLLIDRRNEKDFYSRRCIIYGCIVVYELQWLTQQ